MPDLKEMLWGAVRKALHLCGVSLPGRVTEYDRKTRRASVQPQVDLRMRDGQVEKRTPVLQRPVWLPRGGGFGLWFDLENGDPCVTLIADEMTADFYETGQSGVPVFGQQHSASDAIVLPGGVPDPEQPEVNGPGQAVLGTVDLTSCLIFSRTHPEAPDQGGKLEVRVSVRLDLGGLAGRPVSRSGDKVTLDPATVTAINVIAGAAGAAPLTPLTSTATIDERVGPKVYSE